MNEFIVDTNVPLVANGDAEHMSLDCQENCVMFISKLLSGVYSIVIDDSFHIIREYEQNLKGNTQQNFGNSFLKWLLTNQHNPSKVKQVHINQIDEFNFEEVPQALIDIGFDNSDRKFIAVAVSNNFASPIAQAADSKWIGWEHILNQENIDVLFLCKKELESFFQKQT